MLQDTEWEMQLPVSRPAHCTLPYHKIYSKSNSVVALPVMWYYTCCLKITVVIFQKRWHEIAHAVSFFSENAQFLVLLKKEKKKGKSILKKPCTPLKPNELVRKNQLCDKLINWEQSFDIGATSYCQLTQRKRHRLSVPPRLITCSLLMNAASWHLLNRSLRNFAPEQELSCRPASKSVYQPFWDCSQGTLKSHNFHFRSVPARCSQQGKRKKSSLVRGRHAHREAD